MTQKNQKKYCTQCPRQEPSYSLYRSRTLPFRQFDFLTIFAFLVYIRHFYDRKGIAFSVCVQVSEHNQLIFSSKIDGKSPKSPFDFPKCPFGKINRRFLQIKRRFFGKNRRFFLSVWRYQSVGCENVRKKTAFFQKKSPFFFGKSSCFFGAFSNLAVPERGFISFRGTFLRSESVPTSIFRQIG